MANNEPYELTKSLQPTMSTSMRYDANLSISTIILKKPSADARDQDIALHDLDAGEVGECFVISGES